MAQYIYDILLRVEPGGMPLWLLASSGETVDEPNLLAALNHLGSHGWEVCAVGDLGGDVRQEILLKKRLS
jgi:hypothetical protein